MFSLAKNQCKNINLPALKLKNLAFLVIFK